MMGRISVTQPSSFHGVRSAHCNASSRWRTARMMTPPSCSLVSMNGPSVTLRAPPCTRTRGGGVGALQRVANHEDASLLGRGAELSPGLHRARDVLWRLDLLELLVAVERHQHLHPGP